MKTFIKPGQTTLGLGISSPLDLSPPALRNVAAVLDQTLAIDVRLRSSNTYNSSYQP